MSPLISIIIPNYNSDSTIERTVQSLLSQSYSNWEAIMVDEGSIYDSVLKIKEICARDARFHFFERERLPKGASSCRNIGLAKATGEFIIFLDSDDELLPFCLEERLSKIKTAPDNRFWVFPLATNYKNVFTEKKIPNSNDYLDSFLSYHLYWGIMCPIWNVKFIREIGGFSEELLRLTDPELMIRAMISTNKFEVYNDVKADSIYYIQDKTDKLFNDKVYKSLLAFLSHLDF